LPAGAITEIAGAQSSGRTSLALAFVARQTGEGRACAWVDAGDAFDPESAAASGVVLRQLLWVRCGDAGKGDLGNSPPGLKPEDLAGRTQGLKPPPPSEGNFSAGAKQAAEKGRMLGKLAQEHPSGAKVRADLAAVTYGLKPVPFSRTSFSAACKARSSIERLSGPAEAVPLLQDIPASSVSATGEARGRKKPWQRLEQAIRATDLLLQAGGFAAIVLDLAGTAPEHASRIPLATWFRFRQAAARTRCSLVVLGQAACAQSSAAAVLECAPAEARGKGNTVLGGFTFSVRRSRGDAVFRTAAQAERKPPETAWPADCAWNAEKRA